MVVDSQVSFMKDDMHTLYNGLFPGFSVWCDKNTFKLVAPNVLDIIFYWQKSDLFCKNVKGNEGSPQFFTNNGIPRYLHRLL